MLRILFCALLMIFSAHAFGDRHDDQELFDAVAQGDLAKVEKLLAREKHRPNVNATRRNGDTPLHVAARRYADKDADFPGVIKALLTAGADPSILNHNGGRNPFQEAAAGGCIANIEAFATHPGFDVNMRDSGGWTAMHTAAASNQPDVIRYLYELGAKINVRDFRKGANGWTPLQVANHYKKNAAIEAIKAIFAQYRRQSQSSSSPVKPQQGSDAKQEILPLTQSAPPPSPSKLDNSDDTDDETYSVESGDEEKGDGLDTTLPPANHNGHRLHSTAFGSSSNQSPLDSKVEALSEDVQKIKSRLDELELLAQNPPPRSQSQVAQPEQALQAPLAPQHWFARLTAQYGTKGAGVALLVAVVAYQYWEQVFGSPSSGFGPYHY